MLLVYCNYNTSVFVFFTDDRAILNYRLSRARIVINNSFGILAARWHLLRSPIIAHPKRVRLYVQAAVTLHNFLRTTEANVYCPPRYIDGEDGSGKVVDGGWRQDKETNSGMQSIDCILEFSQDGSNRCVLYCQLTFCLLSLCPFVQAL